MTDCFSFTSTGEGQRVRPGGVFPVPQVRARLRVLRRLLPLHRQPQLGPPHHPAHPSGKALEFLLIRRWKNALQYRK